MKRPSLVILFLIAALLLASCGSNPTAVPTTAPTQPPAVVATAAATAAGAESTEDVSVDPENPKATPVPPQIKGTPPADGGAIGTPGGTPIAVGTGPVINPPSTLDDLIKQYPGLKEYIDKVAGPDKPISSADLSELYKHIVQIYKEKGASGLATFLKDSGILDKLGIPLSYIDLLTAYGDKGDMKAVEKMARDRKIINGKSEISGYLALDAQGSLAAATKDLQDLGVSVYGFDLNTEEVEIGIPLSILAQKQTPELLIDYLTKIAHVNHVVGFRPPTPLTTKSVDWRKLATEGAQTVGADKWHAAGITGKGVRVGILDMGFGGIEQAAGKELPPADEIKSNIPLDELDAQEENHGTACAMVVHGMAPDAELYIAQFDGASTDSLIEAIDFLLKNKVQIVNYSVGSAVGPHDGTFGMAVAVNEIVREAGLLWVNAAGNEALDHTAFKYKDNGKGIHAFSDKVLALPFVPFAPVTTVIMNWNGNWAGKESSEYDFAILDEDGNEVVTAAEPRKGKKNDLPFQAASFEVTPKKVYFMVIHKAKAKTDNILDIFIPNALLPDWAQVPDHSVTTPGDADSALTVGATGLTQDELEIYSSQGPTMDDRLKPDVTAPTGEVLPGYDEGFSGTSGAAPLVAGAAALVWQKLPDLKAEGVKAFLTANVKDLGDDGPDPLYGAGRLALPDPGGVSPDDPGTVDPKATAVPVSDNPSASISNIDTKYNVKVKGVKGLMVSVSFQINNFKGKNGIIAVLFFDKNDKPMPTSDKKYTIGKGLGTGATFSPKGNEEAYDDVGLFIPNSALSKAKAGQYYYIVGILDADNLDKDPLAVSDKVSIKISGSK